MQLTLPAGARLWTAFGRRRAGEASRCRRRPQPGVVRIPLVKTAEGEGDYLVELKYGGRLQLTGAFGSVSFPLIRETNINVEQSQVRLLLPDSQQWFNFQGTMRLVQDESELERGFQSYLNKRIQEATQALSSSSDYTKVRAAVNLKQSRLMLENNRQAQAATPEQFGLVQRFDASNEALLAQAEQQVQEQLGEQQGDRRTIASG